MNGLPSPYQYIALDPTVVGVTTDKTIPEIIHLKHVYSELLDAWIPDITINIKNITYNYLFKIKK